MAVTQKILGQSYPVAGVLTDLYTVPAATSTTTSTLVACNLSAVATNIRIVVRKGGEAFTNKQFLYPDVEIAGNDTLGSTFGMTLAATDVVSVSNAAGTCAFTLFGQERT